jgi:hypothetical protein
MLGMQRLLDVCTSFASQHSFDFNILKCAVMRVGGVDKRVRNDLVLWRKTIPWTSPYRYLGVILCDELSMMPQN